MTNRICRLFDIKYPIIQGGMIWCSGWKLASAVSNAGGLGLIGAGSMHPEMFREHVQKAKTATKQPFGVNIPMLYPDTEDLMKIVVEEGVKIVFTSAGNPKTWTSFLKSKGITVVHVVSNSKFAIKAEEAGVDAIVIEGFEAGGHNGREETTTMVAVPQVRKVTTLPLIAAGGIGTGRGMLAAMALGADGIQMGTRFAASIEASAHNAFKTAIVDAKEGDTMLTLKQLVPVRLIKNPFFNKVQEAELSGISTVELQALLGKGRAKKGMFEGDNVEGELEAGQISSLIDEIKPVSHIIEDIVLEYKVAREQISHVKFNIG
ncbi:MAG: nitronate monooxygenase [Bacteroidales bacterium]|nr:nitronate monooxygenase [Bacteroidales bacterium]